MATQSDKRKPMVEWRMTKRSQRDLRRIATQVRYHSNKVVLRKMLLQGLKKGARPALTNVKNAAASLPSKGIHNRADLPSRSQKGLRDRIVDAASLQVRTTRNPGVKVAIPKAKMGDAPTVPMHMNKGRWRHPVFNRNVWVTQYSRKGWFDIAARRAAPEVRSAVGRVLDDIEKRVNL